MIHLSFEMRSGSGSTRKLIDFTSAGYLILDGYYPNEGDEESVNDSFTLLVRGDDSSDLTEKIRDIELAVKFASEHKSGPDGVWVLFAPENGEDTWQSRILSGTVLHDSRLSIRWKQQKARIQVVIERKPYWETVEPLTLIVDNSAGDAGLTANIVNHEDAGAGDDFYVEIDDDQVIGVLPTPAIIEYKNTTNDVRTLENLLVGHFAASEPHTPPTASGLILEGTGASDAGCSSGTYKALTWSDENESQAASWSLATIDFRQRYYKFVARFQSTFAYTDLWLKIKLLSGSDILAETRWALMSASKSLQVIGTIQIPPFRHGNYINIGSLTVGLYEKRAGGAGTANLDYLAMMPQDSWRKFGAISGLAYNETLIDNPVEETLVTAAGANFKVTHMLDEGNPVMLQPGVKNVLYFLHDCDDGSAAIARTATVAVKCHPRRLSV
jgi:hypothetical protein